MDQFGGDFADWWNSQAWGTVPEWFAAIGTVGAFAATILIIQSERIRRRRAQADAFVTHTSVRWTPKVALDGLSARKMRKIEEEEGGQLYHWVIRLYVHNTSNQPIVYTNLRSDPRLGIDYHVHQTMHISDSGDMAIAPGESFSKDVGGFPDSPSGKEFYLQFIDASGKSWVREIMSGRYLPKSERKVIRDIWTAQQRKWQAKLVDWHTEVEQA
ncbi:hypothetical protein ACFC3F_00345 [Microbacterium sp. NPDC055910]|uniref:hypothetical protein n=1 Tax=Microbacterium sp. NPDC055910 TaxID=3345659 RepID=UPI0035DEA932